MSASLRIRAKNGIIYDISEYRGVLERRPNYVWKAADVVVLLDALEAMIENSYCCGACARKAANIIERAKDST